MLGSFLGRAGLRRRAVRSSAFASLLRNGFAAATITLAISALMVSCQKKNLNMDAENFSSFNKEEADKQLEELSVTDEKGTYLDFDFTRMGSTMVYSQVFNMMIEPETYAGKIFKMTGTFLSVPGPDGKPAYAIIIKDALQCCQQGIEFSYDFGSAVPATDQMITVTGPFTVTVNNDGIMRNFVKADSVEIK